MSMKMDISFFCDCGHEICESVWAPSPNWSAETSRDSVTEDYQDIYCESCGKEHEVYITSAFAGAEISINGGNTEVMYSVAHYPEDEEIDWAIESETQIDIYRLNVSSVQELLAAKISFTAKRSLLVMLHAHVVAATEAYLSSTFIHRVTNSEELTQKLVETDPEFAKQTFSMKELFSKRENIKVIVAKYLKELIFHKLDRVKPMYASVLRVDFDEISWLFKAVLVRHDCVHRAGYDKDGNIVDLSEKSVQETVRQCSELVEKIEKSLGEKAA
ncbi:MAG: hypothetical protein K2P74_00210 [Nitrosomonas sp.]|nr:hypothetical protein [Nitrosomonas sp.]